jgi:hypothetical protein
VGQFLERWFLPALVVLGLICGGIAAGSYNQDADSYLQPAVSPDTSAVVVPAAGLPGAVAGGATVLPPVQSPAVGGVREMSSTQ